MIPRNAFRETGGALHSFEIPVCASRAESVHVAWHQAWPTSMNEPSHDAKGKILPPPWYVQYHYNGNLIAAHWRPPEEDPNGVPAHVWMHGVVAAYEPETPSPPPRRGILYHLASGLTAWFNEGS